MQGAGKSLLLKKLKCLCSEKPSRRAGGESQAVEILPTQPTVGSTIQELDLEANFRCILKEYGGCMAPIWNTAFDSCDSVIYVIDASNCTQISASTVLLLELLGNAQLKEKPFLVFFNKTDCSRVMELAEYKAVMRLDDIRRHASQPVEVLQGSCATCQALDCVLQWIKNAACSTKYM